MDGSLGGVPSGTPLLFPASKLEAVPNTPVAKMLENISINSRLSVPWLGQTPAHDGHAVLIGGAPSLADCVDEIRLRSKAGQKIFALNNAAAFLAERGITADYQVILDPRIENIRFVIERNARHFLIASQCDPCLFRLLREERVALFHTAGFDDLEDYLPPRRAYVAVGGGIVVGLTAMALAYTMGFRALHLYGYDSSDRDGHAHAYPQGEGRAEAERVKAMCAGRVFTTSVAMHRQAEAFPAFSRLLSDFGCTITVHGDGLLPTIARQMMVPPEPDLAIYDLGKAPASWDFAVWLAAAEMDRRRRRVNMPLRVHFIAGPQGGFRDDDLPGSAEDRQRMLDNVLRPLLDLYGATEAHSGAVGYGFDYQLNQIVNHSRSGEPVPMMTAPEWARREIAEWLGRKGLTQPVVITLREASHYPQRNSDIASWAIFADGLRKAGTEVLFVRDTERANDPLSDFVTCPMASLDVRVRAALYERAKCNLFVANGPMALAYFGRRPFLIFKPISEDSYLPATEQWWRHRIGVPPGEQYPWALPTQRIVWGDDTLANITAAWDELNRAMAQD